MRSNYEEWDALGDDKFTLTYHEKSPSSSEWFEISRQIAVPFYITAIADTPDGHNFVIAGVDRAAKVHVTLVSVPHRSGGVQITFNKPVNPTIGESLGLYSASEILPVEFKTPGGPGTKPTETRRTIYSGTALEFVRIVALDPELRFALIVDLNGKVIQFDLTSGFPSTPVVLYDSSSVPSLSDARLGSLFEKSAGGRSFVLSPQKGSVFDTTAKYVVLDDQENDGVFEACTPLSRSEFVHAQLNNPSSFSRMNRIDYTDEW